MNLNLDFFRKNFNDFYLEQSIKFALGQIFHQRFDFWFDGDFTRHILSIFKLFDQLEEQYALNLDNSLLQTYVDANFNLTKLKWLVFGADIRENLCESRLKLWFVIDDYPEKITSLKENIDFTEPLIQLTFNTKFLFGFDFKFDGTSKIKLYPVIYPADLVDPIKKEILEKNFCAESMFLMQHCNSIHVTKDDGNVIVHYHPIHLSRFLESMLQNKILKKSTKKIILDLDASLAIENYSGHVLAFKEEDIKHHSINDFSIYKIHQEKQNRHF